MSNLKWSREEIEAAIATAFSRVEYPTVKSEQPEAARVCERPGRVSLPTGSGKSLCYGCLPLVYDSLCGNVGGNKSIVIVVSPLKALLQDQVRAFCAKCLESAYTT